jgi:Transposase DDE domain group 1
MATRLPASQRTREELTALIEGRLSTASAKDELVKLAARLRADSGFAREVLMAWCEENRVDYVAYVLVCALRRIGLAETIFADATCGTIRLKLLKLGVLVRISVRRIRIAMASACPSAGEWGQAARRLANAAKARAAPA